MGAGHYDERFEWLKRTPGTKDSVGQRADTYPSQGFLWGHVDGVSSNRAGHQESERAVVSGVLTVRGYIGILAGDRLHSMEWGDLWTVRSCRRGDNETVCEVDRPHWSAAGGDAGP